MNAEIIAVGTELLLGDIVNTNAQYLSKKLAELGFSVYFQSVVGDNAARLEELAQQAKQRSDIVIYSGGLGPTEDDLTKETVAKVYEDTLTFDPKQFEKIQQFFQSCGKQMPHNNKKQAMVPTNGHILDNKNGTAPGVIFEHEGKIAILLPGPPSEMCLMFEQSVMPYLQKLQKSVLFSRVLRVYGIGESALETKTAHLLQKENPTSALYAKTAEVVVRITAKAENTEKAKVLCDEIAQEFYQIAGDCLYAEGEQTLEETVVKILTQKNYQLSTAESCTGGLLSQRITAVAGSSNVFSCGICSYGNSIKQKLLNVAEDTLQQHGAVSIETALEMAKGSLNISGSDIAVGITGIAGPTGGTADKPVGLVYVAIADQKSRWVTRFYLPNRSRETVRFAATQKALDMVRRWALNKPLEDCIKVEF